jgi:predicted ArsR family transcriptional regulator
VENNWSPGARLGPRGGSGQRPISASRAAILDQLRDQPEPLTQAALVTVTGLHPNTVREHLDGLRRRGLVRRFRSEPAGRGRPAWLYEATAERGDSEYAGLAAALAATIARTSSSPREDATVDDLSFEPRRDPADPADVRLTRCPLLEAAHRHPDVVCGVHLGIVRGALAEYGADPSGSDLLPFAEPGACRLVVPPTRESRGSR